MSEDGRERFEIPKEMRSMVEASLGQTRRALEKLLAGAQQTAGSIEERGETVRAGAKEIGAKAISCAEKNVQTSLDHAEKLLRAKDLSEVMRMHTEYIQPNGDQCRQAQDVTRLGRPSTLPGTGIPPRGG
jgi:hypothetical protein